MSQNGVNKIDAMREQIGQFFGLREIATFESRPMSIFIVASFWIHLFFASIFFFLYMNHDFLHLVSMVLNFLHLKFAFDKKVRCTHFISCPIFSFIPFCNKNHIYICAWLIMLIVMSFHFILS